MLKMYFEKTESLFLDNNVIKIMYFLRKTILKVIMLPNFHFSYTYIHISEIKVYINCYSDAINVSY